MQLTQHRSQVHGRWIVTLVCGGMLLTGPSAVLAKNQDVQLVSFAKDPQQVNLVVGKSTVVTMPVASHSGSCQWA